MRLILTVLILIVIACGALFGALNGTRIPIDFYFAQIAPPTGGALLGALLVGWLLGGVVAWLGQMSRRHRERRAARHGLVDIASPAPTHRDA